MPTPARRNPSPTRSAEGRPMDERTPEERSTAEPAPDPRVRPKRPPSLWLLGDAWLRRAARVISDSADALNAMNVFPISDADTGSNLELTIGGIASSVTRFQRGTLDDVVQAAILSAHGNSGAIVAEMFTSVCRALARTPEQLAVLPPGAVVAALLRTVSDAANQAVAEPVVGTILTVADEAASAATQAARDPARSNDPLAVAIAAQHGAHDALARTPEQLDVLGRAGVVDAGGQAFVLLVDVLVEVLGGPAAEPLTVSSRPATPAAGDAAPMEYEVMYALRGTPTATLDELRRELSVLGRSVVVVGDEAVAQVHVHLVDAGAAIEAALDRGALSRIRVTALGPLLPEEPSVGGRTLVAVVAGPGLAESAAAMGAVPVVHRPSEAVSSDELARVMAAAHGDVVVLPNDPATLSLSRKLAGQLRTETRRIAVIPTNAQVQGLAALAVHEPSSDFDATVVAMSSAAGHARHGAVTVAERPAMTMAGPCRVGDVLGLVQGDFVEIGDSVVEVGARVIGRLLAGGGELLTLISGERAPVGLVDELARRAIAASRTLEIERIEGGQSRYLVLVGLE
ncbi:DAK2 domain-containing protein [Microlunatus ginsengisoli]|uniref:DAK2 domain-containing protein n=1 Tax=Microlunatus ginsengisoli TaxID=363863 RepID=UPI0031D008C8